MKLYSDIFISKPIQTDSMFVYLTWNRDGKELKTMLEYEKALEFTHKMAELGVSSQIVFESSCPPKSHS